MPDISCPSCGAAVPLRHAAVPYVVCPQCQSLLLRGDDDLRAVGQAAVLPFDVSPIMIGTRGTADGIAFEVVGRVRWGWVDGAWNEWLLALADGSTRWLGEAMGTFMLLADAAKARDLPAIRAFADGGTIAPGTTVTVDGQDFVAADVKTATCLGAEGQLPFAAPKDWAITSIDFRNPAGASLSVQRDSRETSVWIGRYVDLAHLAPKGLRRFDDWAMPHALQ
jgi:predicted RNA-binding Zn-ribbon protein involved in translation (DUF1610 family)